MIKNYPLFETNEWVRVTSGWPHHQDHPMLVHNPLSKHMERVVECQHAGGRVSLTALRGTISPFALERCESV